MTMTDEKFKFTPVKPRSLGMSTTVVAEAMVAKAAEKAKEVEKPSAEKSVEKPVEKPAERPVEKSKLDLANITSDQIKEALDKLGPERLDAIRLAAAKAGLAIEQESERFKRLSNGSIQIQITIPIDLAEALMTLVDAVHEPPHTYIEGILLQGLNAWFIGGPEEEAPAPKPTTAIPTGTMAPTSAAPTAALVAAPAK